MGLLSKLKVALGIGSKNGEGDGTAVTVEHEPETESERAVKESVAAGTDADAATGSMTEEPPGEVAAEPAEAAGPQTEATTTEPEEPHEESPVETEEAVAAGTDADASTGSMTEETDGTISAAEDAEAAGPGAPAGEISTDAEPVEDVKGIGPAYAESLGEVGIETVAGLAAADPADVAEGADLPEKSVRKWTERAKARRE